MIVEKGDKVHIVYRAIYENSNRRHFVGEVQAAEGAVCRIDGYVFIYDEKTTMFTRKKERRTTIVDLAESGYVVNIIDPKAEIDKVVYKYSQGIGLVATDLAHFALNINEFGVKS